MPLVKIHLLKGSQKTTITLARRLVDLLSLKLCGRIEITSVREWCQQQIDHDPGAFESGASQRLASLGILEIASKQLQAAYWDVQLVSKDKIVSKKKRQKRNRRSRGRK